MQQRFNLYDFRGVAVRVRLFNIKRGSVLDSAESLPQFL